MRDLLNVVSGQDDLVLDVGHGDRRALEHWAVSDKLLTQEVSDLEGRAVVADNGVDGEMCVDQSHLVGEALKVSAVTTTRRGGAKFMMGTPDAPW